MFRLGLSDLRVVCLQKGFIPISNVPDLAGHAVSRPYFHLVSSLGGTILCKHGLGFRIWDYGG